MKKFHDKESQVCFKNPPRNSWGTHYGVACQNDKKLCDWIHDKHLYLIHANRKVKDNDIHELVNMGVECYSPLYNVYAFAIVGFDGPIVWEARRISLSANLLYEK